MNAQLLNRVCADMDFSTDREENTSLRALNYEPWLECVLQTSVGGFPLVNMSSDKHSKKMINEGSSGLGGVTTALGYSILNLEILEIVSKRGVRVF